MSTEEGRGIMKADFLVLEDGMHYTKASDARKFGIIWQIQQVKNDYSRIAKVNKNKGEASLDYCGIIVLNGHFVAVLPKRSLRGCESDSDYEKTAIESLPLLVQVLLRFYREDSDRARYAMDDFLFAEDDESNPNGLGAAIHLLTDFERDGLLRRRKKVRKQNSNGRIDWPRTIQRTPAIFAQSGPFYPSPMLVTSSSDAFDPLIMIHRACIEDCYRRWGWLFHPSQVSPKTLDAVFSEDADWLPFDQDEALSVLERELSSSFSDREMSVIRYMQAYIQAKVDPKNQNMFGVTKYHRVWERICKCVFGDDSRFYEPDFLPQPKWEMRAKRKGPAETEEDEDESSLDEEYKKQIPDVLLKRNGTFFILDAKYYDFEYSLPGGPDIIKQYYYEDTIRAYLLQKGVDAQGIEETCNAFIMPDYSGSGIKFRGTAKFTILDWRSLPVYTIDAKKAMESYANQRRVPSESWLDTIRGEFPKPAEGRGAEPLKVGR
ncbi:MAG: LlaJI family restriction endonuclease [Bifidobacterium sp.]|nr:LlaJI family restriction endonuclease [Bifidobacterium sp.]